MTIADGDPKRPLPGAGVPTEVSPSAAIFGHTDENGLRLNVQALRAERTGELPVGLRPEAPTPFFFRNRQLTAEPFDA